MATITEASIRALLVEVGNRFDQVAELVLLGGAALCLLGSSRPTLDLDYVGDDLHKNRLQLVVEQVARELALEVEAVPIEGFVPLPAGVEQRRRFVGQFGRVRVSILDPYTIALSKLDRGFVTDLEDIQFLVRIGAVDLDQLEVVLNAALHHAVEFGLDRETMRQNLQLVRMQRKAL